MLASEIPNLRDGRPFNFLQFSRSARGISTSYSDQSNIRRTVVAVAVNSHSPNPTNCNFLLEIYMRNDKKRK